MVDPSSRDKLTVALAALLLLVGAVRHYGWQAFPGALGGVASKGLGGAAAVTLLFVIYSLHKHWFLLPVVAWYAYEDALVAICSAAYLIEPWYVPPGEAMCSARAGFDFGALSITIVAALCLAVNLRRCQIEDGAA